MSAPTPATAADTRDMLIVHAAFRREFRLASALVSGVADGDVARAGVVAAHIKLLIDLLHIHHGGEDRLLWPRLRQRIPDGDARVLEIMEGQHEGIDADLRSLSQPLTSWGRHAGRQDRDRVAQVLTDLHSRLEEHLRDEEEQLLPLAERHLTPSEWGELAEEIKKVPARQLPIAFGMVMYEGDPDVVANILAEAPLLPRLVMPRVAPRAYARYARRVHGSATP
jgi:hemerythrin-like domain-containing protein